MKFASYPEIREELTEARFRTLKRLIGAANDNGCDLFVISGDLFHQPSIAKRDIIKTIGILKDFEGKIVAILPGNHDYTLPGQKDLWDNFDDHGADNVLILRERKIYNLEHYGINALIYACPCFSKYSDNNALGWVKREDIDKDGVYHIGIAHGSLEGFSPDFNGRYYPMTLEELRATRLDLWLLGHTHIPYPVNPDRRDKIFYPGTPEPDGFDCDHGGRAWILTIDENKDVEAQGLDTGQYRFIHDYVEIQDMRDMETFMDRYRNRDLGHILLKLYISGRVDQDEREALNEYLRRLKDSLFFCYINDDDLMEKITPDTVDQEFSEGSFPHLLLSELMDDPEALQMAYDLIKEVRK